MIESMGFSLASRIESVVFSLGSSIESVGFSSGCRTESVGFSSGCRIETVGFRQRRGLLINPYMHVIEQDGKRIARIVFWVAIKITRYETFNKVRDPY